MTGKKTKTGGKHRYFHKPLRSNQQQEGRNALINFSKKETLFQTSAYETSDASSGSNDSSIEEDAVCDYIENLQVHGENPTEMINLEYLNQYEPTFVKEASASAFNRTCPSDESFVSNDKENIQEFDTEESVQSFETDIEDSNHSDSSVWSEPSETSVSIEQLSDEEALRYIQHLKRKIAKVKAVLKSRMRDFPSAANKESSFVLSEPDNDETEEIDVSTETDNHNMDETQSFRDEKEVSYQGRSEHILSSSRERRKRNQKQTKQLKTDKMQQKKIQQLSDVLYGEDEELPILNRREWYRHIRRLYSKRIDDEWNYAMTLMASKKKPKGRHTKVPVQDNKRSVALRAFKNIRTFLTNSSKKRCTLPVMSRPVRLAVHRYADACGLNSSSRGKEGKRRITIYRAYHWRVIPERDEEFILQQAGLIGEDLQACRSKRGKKSQSRKTSKQAPMIPETIKSARGRRALEESLNVDIKEDNVGHRMLLSMGWSKGQSLGSTEQDGLKQPIAVQIRPPRAGLGSEEKKHQRKS